MLHLKTDPAGRTPAKRSDSPSDLRAAIPSPRPAADGHRARGLGYFLSVQGPRFRGIRGFIPCDFGVLDFGFKFGADGLSEHSTPCTDAMLTYSLGARQGIKVVEKPFAVSRSHFIGFPHVSYSLNSHYPS